MPDFRILGVAELRGALTRMVAEVEAGALEIVRRSQAEVEAEAKAAFTSAHSRGTPTPSSPGTPPAVVTGTLRRSILSETPERIGFGYVGRVYPTTVYARVQELGGATGRNHAAVLPARPYLKPALDRKRDRLSAIAREVWARATH